MLISVSAYTKKEERLKVNELLDFNLRSQIVNNRINLKKSKQVNEHRINPKKDIKEKCIKIENNVEKIIKTRNQLF